MFSFASKMLNTLMGEGEGVPPRPATQIRPPYQQPGPRLQQMTYPRPPTHLPPQPVMRGPEEPNLDLSHLSAEERALIQNVMAKAKDLDTTPKPVIPENNQFRGSSNVIEENRPPTYSMPQANYGTQHSISLQDNFSQPQNIHRSQDNFHKANSSYQSLQNNYSSHKENMQYGSDDFHQPSDSFQDVSSDISQRFDNLNIKQELQTLQDNISSPQRKEFSLQRQESYSQKHSSPYFHNSCWENGDKDAAPRPGNTPQQDCEYSTPSPVSNSPDIRLSPSSPPASPSSEDSRTSLLATTSKDEIKAQLPMESFYDHSPGEVYTIPEEEDEISSPTSDGVTSLRKRRLVGAQSLHKDDGTSLHSPLQSNHYRSNNNFNSFNQNSIKSNSPFGQTGNETEKINGNSMVNQDNSISSRRQIEYMGEMKHSSDISDIKYQSFLDKTPERIGQHTSIPHNMRNEPLLTKKDSLEKPFSSTSYNRPQQPEQQVNQQQSSQLHQQASPYQYPQPSELQRQQQQQQQQNQPQQIQHQLQQQLQQPPQHQQLQQQLQQQQQQLQQQQQQQQQLQQQQQQQQQQLQHQQQQQQLHQQSHLSSQQQQQFHAQQINQMENPLLTSSNQQPSHNLQHLSQIHNPAERKIPQEIQTQNQVHLQQPNQVQMQQQNQVQLQQQSSSHLQQQSNIQLQQQSNAQQQLQRQQQQELQSLQMKKFQQMQRQQLHSRSNSRSPLHQQNKHDSNFQLMKSEAGFYANEDSWSEFNEFPDGLQQFYGKDFLFNQQQSGPQKCKERAFGYQNDMDCESFNLQKQTSQQNNSQAKSSAGTISGMLADFSRALGLSNTSEDKAQEDTSAHGSDKDMNSSQSQKTLSQHQINAQIRANEQFIHGQQTLSPVDYQVSHQGQMLDGKQGRSQNDEMKMSNSRANAFPSPQQYQGSPQQMQLDYNKLQQSNQVQMFNQHNLIQQPKQGMTKEEYLNAIEGEQKALYLQQQLYQKLPEHQPMFAQNLTPQQQQMYQQHMQLQHHAQHLKKIKRTLPQSALDQQRQGQLQKKENNLNIINQSQGIGSGITIQQMMAAQFLSHQPILPVQMLNSQVVGSDMKIINQNRGLTGNSPVLVSSGFSSQQLNNVTPLGTPQSTPVGTPRGRDGGDSSDTMSETDSQKSLRTRRKLPSIPADQEAITLPNARKRDRAKSKNDKFRQFSEASYRISSSNLMLQRPSSSETNLRKISNFGPETIPRPGSALGLLQGSSVVSSSGMQVDYTRDSELASCLPPDLHYLLNTYKSSSDVQYTKQQFIQMYKDHIGNDVKLPVTDRRALSRLTNIDWETERLLNRNKDLLRNPKSRLEIQRKIAYSGIGRNRKIRTHRRQLSDPKIHLEMSPLKDGSDAPYNRGYYPAHPSLRPPYKSYEYESIDDGKLSEWDTSHPYLASYAIAGGALRETAINSVLDKEHMNSDQMRYDMRRYSDCLDLRRREAGKHHKPRSWQPSPYGSDEDEDQMSREQKKAKIKAEIARRRQQIEENARLHEELLRLARLRESAELGYAPLSNTPTLAGDYAMSSVLKSIDDLIGRESDYTSHRTPEDRSMDRIASTFRTDDYTTDVYERLTDFSPLTDFSTPHAMPLLPDMPTRSRKLLEDLGSSPITDSVLTLPQKC